MPDVAGLRFEEKNAEARNRSIINPPLSQYTLGVGVFHLAHLGYQISKLRQSGVRVSASADDMYTLRPVF